MGINVESKEVKLFISKGYYHKNALHEMGEIP